MELVYSKKQAGHDTGSHPESAARLSNVLEWANERKIRIHEPESGERFLGLAHDSGYIDYIKGYSRAMLDMDTAWSKGSWNAACYAAGGAIEAAKRQGFALVRPPGHHAGRDAAAGFCVFNNLVIAAKWLKKRVFIVDFDAHHGDGTQSIVLGDSDLMYFSTHQSPLYPGTGTKSDGNCINVPLRSGAGDAEYIRALEDVLQPALLDFAPEYVAVSAGFDSYYKDAGWLSDLRITAKGYQRLCGIIAPYKKFFVLEGGYNPESIKEGVESIMEYI